MPAKQPKRMRGRPSAFSLEQKRILRQFYEEEDMKSTHKRNVELMERAASEGNISIERVKRFIGAENAKRRKALLNSCNEVLPDSRANSSPVSDSA